MWEFEPRPVPRELLEACLEAAVWAPNRGLTEPWRFVRIGPEGRRRLAGLAAETEGGSTVAALGGCAELVAVLQREDPDPEVAAADRLALGAAIQNILLCAWDEALGGLWIGGRWLARAEVRGVVGLQPGESLVALVALGYPDSVPPVPRRRRARSLLREVP